MTSYPQTAQQPPPLQHQPYSNPPPSSSSLRPIPPPTNRHYSDSARPAPPPDAFYGSSPGMAPSAGYDPSLPTVPAGQPLPPQPQLPVALYPNSGALMPSSAAQMRPPSDRRRSSHESHHSHHSHHSSRPRSSSGLSHRSHHSRHSVKNDKRPTLGDTLFLMWDSFWGAWTPRKK